MNILGRKIRRRWFAASALIAAGVIWAASSAFSNEIVRIKTENGIRTITVEVADEFEEQRIGLMHRTALPDQSGMIFTYPTPVSTAFWMKNTLIPLDMIWISETGRIVGITANARPLSLTPRPSPSPVIAVLEISGGASEELGIQVGDLAVEIPGVDLPTN